MPSLIATVFSPKRPFLFVKNVVVMSATSAVNIYNMGKLLII